MADGAAPATRPPNAPADNNLLRSVPVVFVLLWATGFMVAKYAIPYAAPFTILTLRFAIASAMMAATAAREVSPSSTVSSLISCRRPIRSYCAFRNGDVRPCHGARVRLR